MNKAIFLDRDGVINQTVFRMGKPRAPYSMEEFRFFDGVTEAIGRFKKNNFLLIVVTNQPDVVRGWVTREQVDLINNHVKGTLSIDELYACFHTNEANCECRKPKPGMLLEAAQKWNIDLSKSFMVGDRISDIEAGQSAGCRSILVGPGDAVDSTIIPEFQCADLLEASTWILKQ